MYHQYPDKAKLFLAVLEAVETDVIERLSATVVAKEPKSPAMSIANAEDPEQEKADVRNVIHNLIDGLLSDPDRAASRQDRS
jgi:hypothetical protein